MQASANENQQQRGVLENTITAQQVPAPPERLAHLPYLEGGECVVLERAIFDMLRCLSPDYGGGSWEYYQLSNGGFYMAPGEKGVYTIVYEGIGFSGSVSAQAAGIIACAIAFSHVSYLVKGNGCLRAYELLMDFIAQHPEAQLIRSALD